MKTLFISDLDGTLMRSDGIISDFTKDTINRLVAQGVDFTLATARSISSAKDILKGLNLRLPAVMMNGVFLTDTATQRAVCYEKLDPTVAAHALQIFESCDRPPNIFFYDGVNIDVEFLRFAGEYDETFYQARRHKYHRFEQVDAFSTDKGIIYFNVVDRREIVEPVYEKLRAVEGLGCVMYRDTYTNYYFLEAFPASASKAAGLRRLKELYGFEYTVAFGDNLNDVDLLKEADTGVAVQNANDALKSVADLVIADNDSDGVARCLLEFTKQSTFPPNGKR